MTVCTNVSGCDMAETLTGRSYTIMAVAATLGGNVLVIEARRQPVLCASHHRYRQFWPELPVGIGPF